MRDLDAAPPSQRHITTTTVAAAAKRLLAAPLLALSVLVATTTLLLPSSSAHSATSVRIVNNSTRAIHNLFLSPVGVEAWGDDLLDNVTIGANQSHTLSGLACDGDEVRVIAEDQNGCFMTHVVSCGGGESEWVVTDATTADCGN